MPKPSNQKHVPTKMKALRGTLRADRDGNSLSIPGVKSLPLAPTGFSAETKTLWLDICSTLKAVGLLQTIGIHTIQQYCQQYEFYKMAVKEIKECGVTITTETKYGPVTKKNPAFEGMMNANSIMQAIADRFGFSPLSQSRIKNIGLNAEDPKEDKFGL